MIPPTRAPSLVIGFVLGLSACSAATPTPAPTPAPQPDAVRPVSAPASSSAVAATTSAPPTSPAKAPPVASNDDLARAVVSVFGDTAATHAAKAANNEEPVWDLDVRSYETHERVAHYVQLFTTDARDRFTARLGRGTRYEPMIRAKLRASGMPEDLTYLALIESGYDPHAYSRAAAVGMWQFMTSTARDVGLRVDWWLDERRDPVRSTEGAIRFLGFLQKQFGSLYLAAAAYNGGPGRVARGLTRYAGAMEGAEGEDRFFALAEQDYLRSETKNYVPQLIAAALVAKMPARYGLSVDTTAPLEYDSLHVPAGTSLAVVASAIGASSVTMKDLNPAILRGVTPPDAAMWVHVPVGTAAQAASVLATMSSEERTGYRTVRVAGSPITATAFASREGMTLKQLRVYNPSLKTSSKGRLTSGQSLRVPHRDVFAFARELPDPSIERYGSSTLSRNGYHVVKRGETLGGIAKRYGLSVSRLQSMNGLKGSRVIAGQTLRVSSRASKPVKKTSAKSSTSKSSAGKATKPKASSAKKPTASKSTAAKSTTKSSASKKPTPTKTAAAK